MSELKPCPFCGNDDWYFEQGTEGETEIVCDRCEYRSQTFQTIEDAIKWWETRPIEDALNARIIEVTHLYLQTKDAFNLVTEVLLKQDARIAKLEEKLAELVEVGNKMRDLIEQDYDGYLDETIEWRGVAEEADDVLQEREE